MFTAVLIPASFERAARRVEIESSSEIAAAVGGEAFDVVRPSESVSVFVDDMGAVKESPVFNQSASSFIYAVSPGQMMRDYPVFGDVLVAGGVDAAGETLSIDDSLADKVIAAHALVASGLGIRQL